MLEPLVKCILQDNTTMSIAVPVVQSLLANPTVARAIKSYGLSSEILLDRINNTPSETAALSYLHIFALVIRADTPDSDAVVDFLPQAVKFITVRWSVDEPPVLLFSPKYRLGHPEKYLFSLSKKKIWIKVSRKYFI